MGSPRRRRFSPSAQAAGFTLMEVMIAIVVVGILTAIALPQYNEFVQRSRITEATNGMNDFRTRQEQFFQDNRHYGVGTCGAELPPTDAFALTCVPAGGPPTSGYTLTGTGQSAKGMGSFVYLLTINPASGVVTRSTTTLPSGWTTSGACWVIRKNGGCS